MKNPTTQGHVSLVLSDIAPTIVCDEKWEAKTSLLYKRRKTRQLLLEPLVRITAEWWTSVLGGSLWRCIEGEECQEEKAASVSSHRNRKELREIRAWVATAMAKFLVLCLPAHPFCGWCFLQGSLAHLKFHYLLSTYGALYSTRNLRYKDEKTELLLSDPAIAGETGMLIKSYRIIF